MNLAKYVSDPDAELPLLSDNVGNAEVQEALAQQQKEQREQRVADVRYALEDSRRRAVSLQQNIRCYKRDRDRLTEMIAESGKSRDQNRVALALLVTDAEITPAQRFGLFAHVTRSHVAFADIAKAYGVEYDPKNDIGKTVDSIVEAATALLPDGLLDSLREQGF